MTHTSYRMIFGTCRGSYRVGLGRDGGRFRPGGRPGGKKDPRRDYGDFAPRHFMHAGLRGLPRHACHMG